MKQFMDTFPFCCMDPCIITYRITNRALRFTYDAMHQMEEYGQRVLNPHAENGNVMHYRYYFALCSDELLKTNCSVRDCISIGKRVHQQAGVHINLRTPASNSL